MPGPCQVFTKVSDDSGTTWSAPAVLAAAQWPSQDPPWDTLGPNNLTFANANDGYAYGPDLYRTENGGRSWQQIAVTGQVAAAAAVGADLWFAVWHGCGEYGCTSWELDVADAQGHVRRLPTQPLPISPPPPGLTKVGVPSQLIRPDAGTAYVIGYDSLQVTHNGGASWARASFPCNNTYDATTNFSAGSSTMLWAVCASGSGAGMEQKQLWRSTNSGSTWQGPSPLESDGYSDQIAAITTNVAWRYGDRGNVLHTVDGGRTWKVVLPDLFNQAFGPPTAFAASDNDAWIFDPYGPYDTDTRDEYVTNDAGTRWRTINIATITPSAAIATGVAKTCTSSQLAVTLGERDQLMAQPAVAVIFTNTSSAPCTLDGYPGVAGLDSNGHETAQAYRTPQVCLGGAPTGVPTDVTLVSRAQASALIGGGANPINGESACPADYAAVLVTPPGTSTSTKLPLDFPSCTGLAVTPVVPGASGGFFAPLASH